LRRPRATDSGLALSGRADRIGNSFVIKAGEFIGVSAVGFALAGGGTNWGLANALGSGRSEALQVGAYGIACFGPAYLSGALAFTNWFTTNRSALGDQLTANFSGQSLLRPPRRRLSRAGLV
jgi:hypothetical protein